MGPIEMVQKMGHTLAPIRNKAGLKLLKCAKDQHYKHINKILKFPTPYLYDYVL